MKPKQCVNSNCTNVIYEGMAQKFLEGKGINFTYINSNLPSLIEFFKQDCRKISADIYIDDRCLMGLPDTWKEIYEKIQDIWSHDRFLVEENLINEKIID